MIADTGITPLAPIVIAEPSSINISVITHPLVSLIRFSF